MLPLFFIFALQQKWYGMALIKSISGIRGTIGGKTGDNLTPIDVVKFTAAYGSLLLKTSDTANKENIKVVVGRDGRISGALVKNLVLSTLNALGIDVIDLDYSTTPTVEMAVVFENAAGGIILTASHNPKEWNALKLLNGKGEFINAAQGQQVLDIAEKEDFAFVPVDKLGTIIAGSDALQKHIDAVINYPLVDIAAIKKARFKIVVDAVNSTGAIAVPALLKAMGVKDIVILNEQVTGRFAHNPEPLPEHLTDLSAQVVKHNASLGIAVDPDVDRLCFVCEDGSMFGEEYTLVAVADYILSNRKGNTVSNMSSTRALRDVTEKHGGQYFPSAVGEVNVVNKMKAVEAVIGGEGNGGIIVPDLHYGRDALIGIALFLTHLALSKKSIKQLRNTYPDYFISKNKITLDKNVDVKNVFDKIKTKYKSQPINIEDGLKIEFDTDWVHLRTSNTEPIIRIYAESNFETTADNIARRLMKDISEVM
ncbi:MAG: phosphoglucosamine mutase [Bacteroidota bacterium]|jgi:phosphomannomutase